jgi:hypothetical protein
MEHYCKQVFEPPRLAPYHHQIQTNIMAGNKIADINVQWDFPGKGVCINMRSFIKDLLLNLNWPMPKTPQLSLLTATSIVYGQKTQFTPDKDTSAFLLPEHLKHAQKIIGSPFNTQGLLITNCLLHSMPSAHMRPKQWYTPDSLSECY